MKIIISNKFRKQMEDMKEDYLVNWEKLFKKTEESSVFENLRNDFEKVHVIYDRDIGYSAIVQTNNEDKIVYAKRKGVNRYSRFAYRKKELCNSIIFLLNKNRNNENEYYLVAMIIGQIIAKEPEDLSIIYEWEFQDALYFWSRYALVYNESIIDVATIVEKCPYKGLSPINLKEENQEILYSKKAIEVMREITDKDIYNLKEVKNILLEEERLLVQITKYGTVAVTKNELCMCDNESTLYCEELALYFTFEDVLCVTKATYKVYLN